MEYFFKGLKNFKDFEGRATRKEFWFFVLFFTIIAVLASLVHPILQLVVYLVILVPYISLTVRRLHDTGRSGWWALLGLIPFAGLVVIWFCIKDSVEDNQYGKNRKEIVG